jgi:hypothetical protein
MGKWTVPTIIKQLNTGKITLKFLSSTRDTLTQGNNLADFIKANGFDLLMPIPDSADYRGMLCLENSLFDSYLCVLFLFLPCGNFRFHLLRVLLLALSHTTGKNESLKLSIVDMIIYVAQQPVGNRHLLENPIILYRIGSWSESQSDELKELIYSLFAILPFLAGMFLMRIFLFLFFFS